VSHLDSLDSKRKGDDRSMGKVTDIDTRRSNREIMDIEVRFEKRDRTTKVKPLPHGRLWQPGDEPGDLGFPEGNEYD
jgi:hypothetical protein